MSEQDVIRPRRLTIDSRRKFYDWLAETIRIDGIESVERDTASPLADVLQGM